VFWALLFLCSQGRVDLQQNEKDLFGPLELRCLLQEGEQLQRTLAFPPSGSPLGSAALPARELRAA
jgi:segregation and condensation protein A